MREIYLLSNTKYDGVENIGVFEIKYLKPKFVPKEYEAIIFTSKNGVFGIDEIYKEWKKLPAYSIGEGTSRVIKELGGNLVYEAEVSYGDDFAVKLSQKLSNKFVLFARAKVVASDVKGILKSKNVRVDEVVVYESVCKPCEKSVFPQKGIFIFTSPSSVKCFFKYVKWDESFTAIAIGQRTASAFSSDINPLISPKPNIGECVAFAKKLSKISL
ncbi:MAG: uroporphyrinogen-III synthase [Campylobacteraceae bacterium]|jgi:uroporphyrinogen-III synthase|nr:uroporphyrinogen-III synthase [Campylobacteraceae bacterium]